MPNISSLGQYVTVYASVIMAMVEIIAMMLCLLVLIALAANKDKISRLIYKIFAALAWLGLIFPLIYLIKGILQGLKLE